MADPDSLIYQFLDFVPMFRGLNANFLNVCLAHSHLDLLTGKCTEVDPIDPV